MRATPQRRTLTLVLTARSPLPPSPERCHHAVFAGAPVWRLAGPAPAASPAARARGCHSGAARSVTSLPRATGRSRRASCRAALEVLQQAQQVSSARLGGAKRVSRKQQRAATDAPLDVLAVRRTRGVCVAWRSTTDPRPLAPGFNAKPPYTRASIGRWLQAQAGRHTALLALQVRSAKMRAGVLPWWCTPGMEPSGCWPAMREQKHTRVSSGGARVHAREGHADTGVERQVCVHGAKGHTPPPCCPSWRYIRGACVTAQIGSVD